jgi:hypothetical protein
MQAHIQPSLFWTIIWFSAEGCIPFLHVLHMKRVVAQRQAVSQLQPMQTPGVQVKAQKSRGLDCSLGQQSYPVASPEDSQLKTAASPSSSLPPGPGVSAQSTVAEGQLRLHQRHDPRATLRQAPTGSAGSNTGRAQSWLALQRVVQQAGAGRPYRSRLAQPQVGRDVRPSTVVDHRLLVLLGLFEELYSSANIPRVKLWQMLWCTWLLLGDCSRTCRSSLN